MTVRSRFYKCRNCHFMINIKKGINIDQAMGNEDSVVHPDESRVSIEDLPVIFQCPMCNTARDDFDEDLEAELIHELE